MLKWCGATTTTTNSSRNYILKDTINQLHKQNSEFHQFHEIKITILWSAVMYSRKKTTQVKTPKSTQMWNIKNELFNESVKVCRTNRQRQLNTFFFCYVFIFPRNNNNNNTLLQRMWNCITLIFIIFTLTCNKIQHSVFGNVKGKDIYEDLCFCLHLWSIFNRYIFSFIQQKNNQQKNKNTWEYKKSILVSSTTWSWFN